MKTDITNTGSQLPLEEYIKAGNALLKQFGFQSNVNHLSNVFRYNEADDVLELVFFYTEQNASRMFFIQEERYVETELPTLKEKIERDGYGIYIITHNPGGREEAPSSDEELFGNVPRLMYAIHRVVRALFDECMSGHMESFDTREEFTPKDEF